jgi:hypothetical protein
MEMSKQHNSVMILTILILCMISVWIAPVFLMTGMPAMDFAGTDSDSFEFEEDLILVNRSNDGIVHPMSLRIGTTRLNIEPASLAHVFSPPKPFSS